MKPTRRIAMKKRETQAQRAVSFSKRRYGLFNKAAELCILSGSQVAVLVSSPCSKQNMYSFGHPSVEAVLDAFLDYRVPEAVGNDTMSSAVSLYSAIKALEKKSNNRMEDKMVIGENIDGFWRDFEILEKCESHSELQIVADEMEKLKENAFKRLNDLLSSNVGYDSNIVGDNAVNEVNGIVVYKGVDENNALQETEAESGFIDLDAIFELENSNFDHGICGGLASDNFQLNEKNHVKGGNDMQDGDLWAITESYFDQDGVGMLGNQVDTVSASKNDATDVTGDQNNVILDQESDYGAIAKYISNLPGCCFHHDGIGLENSMQDDFGNLLTTFPELYSNQAPFCPSMNTYTSSTPSYAQQNVFNNPIDEPMPIATVDEFEQLLFFDDLLFF